MCDTIYTNDNTYLALKQKGWLACCEQSLDDAFVRSQGLSKKKK